MQQPISDGRYHSPDWPDNSIHETTSEEENISNPEDGSDVELPFSPYRQQTTIEMNPFNSPFAFLTAASGPPSLMTCRPAPVTVCNTVIAATTAIANAFFACLKGNFIVVHGW
jgi:hypothetical protein